ncbi:2'-5' RNA ligase family protein [soil metagenome]
MNLFLPPDVSDRLMLALAPPPAVANLMALAAEQVRAASGLHARVRPREQLNLVLQSLGDHAGLRRDIVSMTAGAAASVAPPGPIELCFDVAETRMTAPGRFDLVLKSSAYSQALEAFQKALGLAMAREGLGRLVDQRFEPHILVIENVKSGPNVAISPIHWSATSFSLLHALLGRHQHVPLARWSLEPQQP